MFGLLRRRSFPKTAVCLHISHPPIAFEILEKLKAITAPFTLIVSHSHPLPELLFKIFGEIEKNRPVEIHHESNIGFDILPFLYLLPRLRRWRFDIVCKLHTISNYADSGGLCRDLLFESLIGGDKSFRKIVHYLDTHPTVGMLGLGDLYMSSRYLMKNDERDMEALLTNFAPDMIGSEWGYFAGSMFWARTETLFPIYDLSVDLEAAWRYSDRDIAHAVEPIFGLLPLMKNQAVAIVDSSSNGSKMRELDDMDDPKKNFVGQHLLEINEKRRGGRGMSSP